MTRIHCVDESEAARAASLVAVFHEQYVSGLGNSGKLMLSSSLTFDVLSSVLLSPLRLFKLLRIAIWLRIAHLGFKKRMVPKTRRAVFGR